MPQRLLVRGGAEDDGERPLAAGGEVDVGADEIPRARADSVSKGITFTSTTAIPLQLFAEYGG